MAQGTVKWFAQGLMDIMNKLHDWDTDTIKLGIVTTATVPAIDTAAPHWGGTGTTNFATNQVGTGGTSYTGPQTIGSKSTTLVTGGVELRAGNISLAQDASGFTTGAYGIIYNDTDTNKRALGYIELSSAGAASLVAGPVAIDWNGANNVVFNILQS